MGMALSRNRGSVGRCQLRYCQGLIWSAWSQRFTVEAEMLETMPRWITARASSGADQRESGLPESRGSVQAKAVTCARAAEGEKARPAGPRRFLERRSRPAPAAPLPHGPVSTAHRPRDGRVRPVGMLVRAQEYLGPYHLSVGRRATSRDAFELFVLGSGESDAALRFRSARSRDFSAHRPLGSDDIRSGLKDLETRNEFMIRCT